jgi:hypothetical protein
MARSSSEYNVELSEDTEKDANWEAEGEISGEKEENADWDWEVSCLEDQKKT